MAKNCLLTLSINKYLVTLKSGNYRSHVPSDETERTFGCESSTPKQCRICRIMLPSARIPRQTVPNLNFRSFSSNSCSAASLCKHRLAIQFIPSMELVSSAEERINLVALASHSPRVQRCRVCTKERPKKPGRWSQRVARDTVWHHGWWRNAHTISTDDMETRGRQSHHKLPQCGVDRTSQMRDCDEQLKFEGNCSQCGEWSHQKKVHSYGLHHGAAHSLHQALATILRFLGGRNRLSHLGVITSSMH